MTRCQGSQANKSSKTKTPVSTVDDAGIFAIVGSIDDDYKHGRTVRRTAMLITAVQIRLLSLHFSGSPWFPGQVLIVVECVNDLSRRGCKKPHLRRLPA